MKLPLALFCLLVGSAGVAPAATLEVHTQPEVEVYWEGVLLATTDADGVLMVEDVPEGPFDLELRKPGYESLTTRVQIGQGTTRMERELVALAQPVAPPVERPEPAAEPGTPAAEQPGSATPAVRVSAGGWLALIATLGLLAAAVLRVLRSRQRTPAAPPPPSASRVTREPAGGRTFEAAKPSGGTFLSELRQRERAMDDLVDVSSAEASGGNVENDDVVDVVWKEVD